MIFTIIPFIRALAYELYLATLVPGYCDEQGHGEDVSFFSLRHFRCALLPHAKSEARYLLNRATYEVRYLISRRVAEKNRDYLDDNDSLF